MFETAKFDATCEKEYRTLEGRRGWPKAVLG